MKPPQLQTLDPAEAAKFETLAKEIASGIALIPEPYGEENPRTLNSASGDFVKWLKVTNKEVDVHLPQEECPRVLLRNQDYWFPLVYLAANVILPVFLGIVSNYLYDKAKGALKGEKSIAHIKAIYRDKKSGVLKKFEFEGDAEQLKAVVKKFDPNEFMNGDEK